MSINKTNHLLRNDLFKHDRLKYDLLKYDLLDESQNQLPCQISNKNEKKVSLTSKILPVTKQHPSSHHNEHMVTAKSKPI